MTEPHQSDLTRAIQAALKLSQRADLGEGPVPDQGEATREDERLAWQLVQAYRAYKIAPWGELGEATRVDWRRVTAKARELLCPPIQVDRDGLARALLAAMNAHTIGRAWHTDGLVAALADAAISYMGARPVDRDMSAALGVQTSYAQANAKERDEQQARADLLQRRLDGIDREITQPMRADIERLTRELAEARRQPAQGGLPEVGLAIGTPIEVRRNTTGASLAPAAVETLPWEPDEVKAFCNRGCCVIDSLGELHGKETTDYWWRRVPQPQPAVATKEEP